jgi:PPE-repeat protein
MLIGETISSQLWSGPGAGSFFSAAAELTNVAEQISNILDGQQANAGAVLTAWAAPTGERAVSANSPYEAWLAGAMEQIQTAASQIEAAGYAFEHARAMTPTPAQFALNDAEFVGLLPWSWVPGVLPVIIHNRMDYSAMTHQAVTAMAHYTTESAATIGAIEPLSAAPTPASFVPADPSIASGVAGTPIGPAVSGALSSAVAAAARSSGAAAKSAGAAAPVVSQVASQAGSLLTASDSELAQAPTAMTSGLGALQGMAQAPMMSGLGSQAANASAGTGAGADSDSWLSGGPASGATVAAALSGGGGDLGGLGGATLAPVRGPVSWASTTNAANPAAVDAEEVSVSRFAEARAGSAMPGAAPGMGSPGAMMPPAQQSSASARERGQSGALGAAGVLYRPPRNLPVVTGAAGTQFATGEEGQ